MKRADQLLREMGYNLPTFDSGGFCELVSKFFTEKKDPGATILLVPERFVAMQPAGDIESLTSEELVEYKKKQEELEESKRKGWIDLTDVTIWEKKVDDPYDPFTFTDYIIANNKGLLRPMIYIDEPYIKNAAQVLTMFGFVCKKQRGKILVSLI